MPTKDGFDPAHPLPRFLADQADQADQADEQGIGNALDQVAPTSRVFKASILIAAATATGIAVLAAGDPAALLAWGSATLVGNSSQSTPTIQSVVDAPALIPSATDAQVLDAQVLPPTTKDAPARDEIAASEPAGKDRTENSELATEALFRQFQAWAAEREAKAREPVQPVQDAPAQLVQQNDPAPAAENVRVPNRLVQKRRQVRSVHNARAEIRTQHLRKQVRRVERARAERPPVQAERPAPQDARAQDTSVQNAPPLPFLFGQRN